MFSISCNEHRTGSTTLTQLVLAMVWLFTVGCNAEGPTGPSPLFLPYENPIANTTHKLTLSAFDFLVLGPNVPILPSCVGIGPSRLKSLVSASVMVRRIDATWRVVPATGADGKFALYLHAANGTSQSDVPVTGTIRGFMNNTAVALSHERGDVRVTFDAGEGDVPLEGTVHHYGTFAKGLVGGPITFSAPEGPEIRCVPGTVSWSLSGPLP
jgi:hypothetical protein